MKTFGLTGGIASGKSTVTKTLRAHNIPVVDADIVARQVVEVGTKGWRMLQEVFGPEYFNEDQTLNRTKLGTLVFSNKEARSNLDAMMFPLVNDEATAQIKKFHDDGNEWVGYDAALICEMGHADQYRPLVVVYCDQEIQIARLCKRNGLTRAEAMLRIEAQMSTDDKIKLSDWTIDTSGTIEESIADTKMFIKSLRGEPCGP